MILSEITGYITMPFHGEKGESAYEIAVRNGYEGTEKEWVDSLGFIPDSSIAEAKLDEDLKAYIKKGENIEKIVLDEVEQYKKTRFNVYTEECEEKSLPYMLKGTNGAYSVKLPKLDEKRTAFDENNEALWSDASNKYSLAKADASNLQGKKVRIYGKTRSMPYYPLAFCVDSEGNILERYGTEEYKVYGYNLPPNYTTTTTEAAAIEAIIPENAKYIYIQGGLYTSGSQILLDAEPVLEVYEDGYTASDLYKRMQSPLWGKKLYVDGDSICYGNGYEGGFGKIIADKFNMSLENNAVGGATVSKGTSHNAAFGTLNWDENEHYYLKLESFDPFENKNKEGFIVPITKDEYDNGFGVYPTVYRLTDGELVEQPYSETMPSYTFFVKFNVGTYGDNTIEKYYRMWSANNWLWEAYKSGFAAEHEAGNAKFGTARHWLCESVNYVASDADYIIFEGGLNDYLMDRPLGKITYDMTGIVDTTTTIGAMEYLCRQLLEKCIGKKILFVLTHKVKNYAYIVNPSYSTSKATLTDYHDAILSVLKKYSIPCVDLFSHSAFNTELESYLAYTKNNDASHPTEEGYELFYVPHIVSKMERI